ncbi:hypothetical protein NBE98_17915 [Clostridium swellfunianum]|nr:hypothetical protein [Clostridium swellfunianum]
MVNFQHNHPCYRLCNEGFYHEGNGKILRDIFKKGLSLKYYQLTAITVSDIVITVTVILLKEKVKEN